MVLPHVAEHWFGCFELRPHSYAIFRSVHVMNTGAFVIVSNKRRLLMVQLILQTISKRREISLEIKTIKKFGFDLIITGMYSTKYKCSVTQVYCDVV